MKRIGLLEQFRIVRANPQAGALACALGGIIPAMGCVLIHAKLVSGDHWNFLQVYTPVALACLAFSITTVWQWGMHSGWDAFKTATYIFALEGSMAVGPLALAIPACIVLVGINAIATAASLVSEDEGLDAEAPAPAQLAEEIAALRARRSVRST